jgi:type I restriction enzyme S subunit
VQIRKVAALGTGHTPSRSVPEYWVPDECTIPWLTLADVWQVRDGTKTVVTDTEERISPAGVANSSAVIHSAGTVALSRTASVGFSCILGTDMATSQDWVTWTCGPRLLPRYLLRALRAMRSEIIGRRQGSTHKTIYMPDIEQLKIPLPPIDQQHAVAHYIDSEANQINEVTQCKDELLERINERIDCKILTLIGSSDLVDPRGTPSKPLKRVLTRRLETASDQDEMITAYRDGAVTARSKRRPEGYTEAAARIGLRRVEVGDVVVHGLDGFSGAIGRSDSAGACSAVYHVCFPSDGGDCHFYGRLLRLLATTGYLGNFASSTRERAVDFRNWDLFGRIPIPIVAPTLQRQIGDEIRAVEPLAEAIRDSRARAVELRDAIIYQAIYGFDKAA